jgi:hypothetical protein
MPAQARAPASTYSGTLRCAIRTKTVAAQDWSTRRRLEGHRIVLAALVARDVESLTVTCLSSSSAKVGPPCIAAWLAPFWMSQITFLVILLFAFRKCEGSVALRTRYLEVWHRGFSTRAKSRQPRPLCSSERWRRVSFIHEVMVRKRCFLNTTPKSYASRRLIAASVLQQMSVFKHFVWRLLIRKFLMCGASATLPRSHRVYTSLVTRHIACSLHRP